MTVWSIAEWRLRAEIRPAGTAISGRDQERQAGERDRAREGLGDDPRDLDAAAQQGGAEVALQHEAEPLDVLHPDRLIEAELLAQRIRSGRVGDVEQHRRDRVARHRPQHEEHERGDRPHDQDRAERAPEEIAAHGVARGGTRASQAARPGVP